MKLVLPYIAIVVAMMLLDAIWIGGVARPLYDRGIGALMAAQPNWPAAAAFYLLFAIGLMAFAVLPCAPGEWKAAAARGAGFGFMAYMTYDLTNLATLRDWPLALSLVDMAWGCVATGLAATIGKLAADKTA